MMADCRSLIEFLRGFEQHRKGKPLQQQHSSSSQSSSRITHRKSSSPNPFCHHSPLAAIDAFLLLLVLGALAFLTLPYFNLLLAEAADLLSGWAPPPQFDAAVVCACLFGVALASVAAVAAWELVGHHARKCGKPRCKGLKKAVEFDIQLETEECVRRMPPVPLIGGVGGGGGCGNEELGEEHKELEAELRKMAPPNGRTVLIFRSPCGCPKGRMEVWGVKKVRRIKK